MGFFRNIKESIDDTSSISVSGITLLISSFIGFLLGLVMCFVLVYDVVTNGYLKTDLTDAGIFLLCSGGYIAGSGIPRSIVDSRLKAKTNLANERLGAEFEDKYNRPIKKRRRRDEEDDESYEEDTDNEK
jgi:hypothetical protein